MKKFKFKINGNKYEVHIKDFENNIVDLEVNGTSYKVEVDQEIKKTKTPTLIRAKVPVSHKESKIEKRQGSGYQVKAPLPGTVLKILVRDGDSVTKGQNLLIMEAMKMENNVLAEKDGVVSAVKISEGQAVLQDDLLLEIA